MRKLTPLLLGLASISWIIGGTVWYKNRFCDSVQSSSYPSVSVSQVANTSIVQPTPFVNNYLANGIELTINDMPEARFQALNLYYSTQNFQFKMTNELEAYFTGVKKFLTQNPTAKLQIYACNTNTSVKLGRIERKEVKLKRLAYLKNVLKNRDFNLNQFQFDLGSQTQQTLRQENVMPTNQKVEIRLVSL